MKRCRSKNCLYDTRDIKECDCVQGGNGLYYHKKCKEYKDKMGKCIVDYKNKISRELPDNLLGKAFKDMIYVKGINPDYILFTIDYCGTNHMKVNTVFSLYYIMEKKKVKEAFEEYKNHPMKFDVFNTKVAEETKIEYHPIEKNNWSKIYKK